MRLFDFKLFGFVRLKPIKEIETFNTASEHNDPTCHPGLNNKGKIRVSNSG